MECDHISRIYSRVNSEREYTRTRVKIDEMFVLPNGRKLDIFTWGLISWVSGYFMANRFYRLHLPNVIGSNECVCHHSLVTLNEYWYWYKRIFMNESPMDIDSVDM